MKRAFWFCTKSQGQSLYIKDFAFTKVYLRLVVSQTTRFCVLLLTKSRTQKLDADADGDATTIFAP